MCARKGPGAGWSCPAVLGRKVLTASPSSTCLNAFPSLRSCSPWLCCKLDSSSGSFYFFFFSTPAFFSGDGNGWGLPTQLTAASLEEHACAPPPALSERVCRARGGGSWEGMASCPPQTRCCLSGVPSTRASLLLWPKDAVRSGLVHAHHCQLPSAEAQCWHTALPHCVGQHSPWGGWPESRGAGVGSCSLLFLMLQLAQLPHHPGNSQLGEGNSPLPPAMGRDMAPPATAGANSPESEGPGRLGSDFLLLAREERWRTGLQCCSFVSISASLPRSSLTPARNTGPLPSLGRKGTPCWGKEPVRTKSVAHSCTSRQEQCPWWIMNLFPGASGSSCSSRFVAKI